MAFSNASETDVFCLPCLNVSLGRELNLSGRERAQGKYLTCSSVHKRFQSAYTVAGETKAQKEDGDWPEVLTGLFCTVPCDARVRSFPMTHEEGEQGAESGVGK